MADAWELERSASNIRERWGRDSRRASIEPLLRSTGSTGNSGSSEDISPKDRRLKYYVSHQIL